ncbi:MAG: inositol monophosphatase [Planctomycetes bacterium]|nr:inositol monophosphatase [Planctomycetota bacterium]
MTPLPSRAFLRDASRFAARLAGREGKAILAGLRPSLARPKGSPDDPVTDADLAVERRIFAEIAAKYPDHGLYGEESGFLAPERPFTWVVDPIDGTGNFAAGLPLFAVSIALLHERAPVATAAFSALERVAYRAERGGGAWKGARRLHLQDRPPAPSPIVGLQSRRGMRPYLPRFLGQVGKFRRLGSAVLHLLAVASDAFDAGLDETARCHDLAAAALILREAGGVLLRFDGSPIEGFDLSPPRLRDAYPGVAGSPVRARWLLDLVSAPAPT